MFHCFQTQFHRRQVCLRDSIFLYLSAKLSVLFTDISVSRRFRYHMSSPDPSSPLLVLVSPRGNGFIGHEVPGVPVTPLEPLAVLLYYTWTYFQIFISVCFWIYNILILMDKFIYSFNSFFSVGRVCRCAAQDLAGKGLEGLGGDLSLVLRLSALFTARRPCLASCQGWTLERVSRNFFGGGECYFVTTDSTSPAFSLLPQPQPLLRREHAQHALLLWPPAAVRGALLALAPLLSPVAFAGAFFQPRCAPCGPWSFWGCLSCFSWARQLSSPPCLTSREREGAEKEQRRTREGAEQGQKGVEKQ